MTEAKNTPDPKALAMPHEFVLQNGLRIVTLSTPTLDSARMSVTVNSGAWDDPSGYEGTAHFLEHMIFQGSLLNRGNLERSAETNITQTFKEWGGKLNAATGKMKTTYGFNNEHYRILDENLEEAADVLLEMVQHPRIHEANVNSERKVIKTELTGKNTDALVYGAACSSLYPDSRLWHSGIGTLESVDRITGSELRQFWRTHYVPPNTTIFIQGKATDEELLKIVTDRLTVLGVNRGSLPIHPALNAAPGDVRQPIPTSKLLSYRFSWETDKHGVSEYNKKEAVILSALLAMLGNELHIRLREQDRSVYSASVVRNETGAAVFCFDSEQDPQKLTQSFTDFMKCYDKCLNQEAFDKYKKSLRIQYIKFFENSTDVAFAHANRLISGEEIYHSQDVLKMAQMVTLDEIKEMAARIFGKPFGMAVVGNQALMQRVPHKAYIKEAMHLTPNDKPIAGSFPAFDDIKPYDARHGQTEPLPNPIQHRAMR